MELVLFFGLIVGILVVWVVFFHKDEEAPATPSSQHYPDADSVGVKEPQVQRLRYFCIKDKGYHTSVWPKDQGVGDCLEFPIAGITHGEHVDEHIGEFAATLEPDPSNPYDPQAIKIVTSEGHRVGYVPKDMTADIRNFTTLPCACYCYIGQSDGIYFTDCYITGI